MDWLRRNWPDLLIGIALVAVIAGIIATLITGGSFFTIGQQPQQPPPQVSTLPNTATPVVPEVPAPQVEDPTAPVDGAEPEAGVDEGPTVAVLPPATTPPATDPVEVEQPAAPTPEVIPPTTEPTPDPVTVTPTPVEVSLPEPSGEEEAPFRVSVGAFSTVENAERQSQIFRDAGFPVLIGSQGELSLVLVGPFDTRAEAEAAAVQVQDAGLFDDPLIYTFRPDDAALVVPVAELPATTPPAPAPAPTTAASGRFLQVGAYASTDSAEPQRQQLTSLGFSVTDRVEDGLVKLLVGPFEGAELDAAQSRLEAAGIESFPR